MCVKISIKILIFQVAPTISNLLHGYPVQGYMYVRRIPFSQVPEKEEEAAKFLQNLFVEKDKIIDSFHNTGSFFTESGFKEPASKLMVPRIYTLLNFIVGALVSILPLMYYLINSLLSANWIGFFIVVSILVGSKYFFKKYSKTVIFNVLYSFSHFDDEKINWYVEN